MKPRPLLASSTIGELPVSREDCIVMLVAINSANFAQTRKVAYLAERLQQFLFSDPWQHSTLNRSEDLMLRYWYLTRGNNAKLTERSWDKLFEETHRIFFGYIDWETVTMSKVMRFANSITVVKPAKHRAPPAVGKPKGKPSASLEDLERALANMKGQPKC